MSLITKFRPRTSTLQKLISTGFETLDTSRASKTSFRSIISRTFSRATPTPSQESSSTSPLKGRISPPPKVVSNDELESILRKQGLGQFEKKD